ncbi:MAG: prephenate dehydrogenase, partial [Salinirussus sp.]
VPEPLHTPISEGLSDLVEQVTGGDSRVYADIQDAFQGAGDVADAARLIADADTAAFERLYAEAGEE